MVLLVGTVFLVCLTGCGERKKTQNELAVGNWTLLRNRAYILYCMCKVRVKAMRF